LAGVLTLDEARRMTLNFAKLPDLLKRPGPPPVEDGEGRHADR
jgi:hypothetical protein